VLLQVLMDAEVLALAVMTDLLSGEQRRRYTDMIDSPYMPALRAPVPLSHVDRPKKLPTAPQVRRAPCMPAYSSYEWCACLQLSMILLCIWFRPWAVGKVKVPEFVGAVHQQGQPLLAF
jgi:hypothetical protein